MPQLSAKLYRGAHEASGTGGIPDLASALSEADLDALIALVDLDIAGDLDVIDELPIYPRAPHRRDYGMAKRARGTQTRFVSIPVTESVKRSQAALSPTNPALKEGRTIYTTRVFDAKARDRVLISGLNNSKLGKLVTKGPWAGSPIYQLSLEERKTCPRSCAVWDTCYGNGMPAAVRFRHNDNLMRSLHIELRTLNRRYPRGFVVRLHVLGDFPDLAYVNAWTAWSDEFPALHVEGYTAHPRRSEIGQAIWRMNLRRPTRWQIRNSVALGEPCEPMQVSSLWDGAKSPPPLMDAIVCPQELGKTETCGTCALCWSPAMADKRVLFLGHGGRTK